MSLATGARLRFPGNLASRGSPHLLADGRPKRGEPQIGSGMQQARGSSSRGSRQGGAKPRRRNGIRMAGRHRAEARSPPRGSGCSAECGGLRSRSSLRAPHGACMSMEGQQARRRSVDRLRGRKGGGSPDPSRRQRRGGTEPGRSATAPRRGEGHGESCLIRLRAGPARTIRPKGRPGDGSRTAGSSEGPRAAPAGPFVVNSVDPRWKTNDLEDPANLRS